MNRAVLTKIFMIYDTYTRLELQHFRKNNQKIK